jgi:hypothetical protein
VSTVDLLLRQSLDPLEDLRVGHLEHYKFSRHETLLHHLLLVLLPALFSLHHWNAHKDFLRILVLARVAVHYVASVQTIILGQSPLVALVHQLLTQLDFNRLSVKRLERLP